jgi:hypothetical protein
MEISLPDEHGRMQILKIHTAKMRDNGIMGEDVDLEELATLTKNYSGAEINGTCPIVPVSPSPSLSYCSHLIPCSTNRTGKVGLLLRLQPARQGRGHG